jgi:hypothetical protein
MIFICFSRVSTTVSSPPVADGSRCASRRSTRTDGTGGILHASAAAGSWFSNAKSASYTHFAAQAGYLTIGASFL